MGSQCRDHTYHMCEYSALLQPLWPEIRLESWRRCHMPCIQLGVLGSSQDSGCTCVPFLGLESSMERPRLPVACSRSSFHSWLSLLVLAGFWFLHGFWGPQTVLVKPEGSLWRQPWRPVPSLMEPFYAVNFRRILQNLGLRLALDNHRFGARGPWCPNLWNLPCNRKGRLRAAMDRECEASCDCGPQ